MSGVVKFLKSLMTAEPATTRVLSKTTDLSQSSTPPVTPSSSPNHSVESNVQTVKPHVPLIKFRKGSPAHGHSAASGSPSSGVARGNVVLSRGTIEDYQLPSRYQRTPMDEKEIDYINRGGPE
ncbi:28S ribosomal protein S36, mitochondrial [Frankliniella fusca]|uniref:28S ribosomal protein S36, mitochondrial n=1 Tax=Frankliniella fusca TaxID=407009 RepID=A0AAE1HVC6_9NEOP|nr:28S ribosomal protein S36, mitochondrial [Frankliniella fusca]